MLISNDVIIDESIIGLERIVHPPQIPPVSLVPADNANSDDGLRPISESEGDGQQPTTTTTPELNDINPSLITDDPHQDNQSTDDIQRTTRSQSTTRAAPPHLAPPIVASTELAITQQKETVPRRASTRLRGLPMRQCGNQ